MSTQHKATWTTLIQARWLDKPVTLELVGAATLDTNKPFLPTS